MSDCLVVGKADERFGEVVAAVVSLTAPMSDPAEELKEFCREQLARYKLPRAVRLVEKVQRAPNGKADYKWARALIEDGDRGSNE